VENEVLSITEERDRVLQDLQSAMANHEKELAERCHIYWQIYMGLSAWFWILDNYEHMEGKMNHK